VIQDKKLSLDSEPLSNTELNEAGLKKNLETAMELVKTLRKQ
jgi:hypothetical protein